MPGFVNGVRYVMPGDVYDPPVDSQLHAQSDAQQALDAASIAAEGVVVDALAQVEPRLSDLESRSGTSGYLVRNVNGAVADAQGRVDIGLPDLAQIDAMEAVLALFQDGVDATDLTMAAATDDDDSAFRAALTRTGGKPVGQGELVVSVLDHRDQADPLGLEWGAAIAAARDAAIAKGKGAVLSFPANTAGGYRTTDTVDIPNGINIDMQAPILYDGPSGRPALVVGTTNPQEQISGRIMVRRVNLSDWANEADVGVILQNLNYSNLFIAEATNFTIGLKCRGDAWGFAYNHVTLGRIRENWLAVDLDATRNGWVNENTFYGGSLSHFSSTHPTKSRIGVRITSSDGTYLSNNSNVFYHPSFELRGQGQPFDGTCVLVVHGGMGNKFLDVRHETSSAESVVLQNNSRPVVFTTAYNDEAPSARPVISEQGAAAGSLLRLESTMPQDSALRVVHKVDDLARRACYYNGTANQTNVPGLAWQTSYGAFALNRFSEAPGVTIHPDHLEIGGLFWAGFFVSTARVKRFTFLRDAVGAAGGRLAIRAFDSGGNPLTAAGTVRSNAAGIFSHGTGFGGAWRETTDTADARHFTLAGNVDHIFIGASGGSASAKLRAFALVAMDLSALPGVWLPWHDDGANVATAAPTTGTWERGRRIMHAAPAIGSPQGWVCTTAGTPGTWTPMPNL